MRTFSQQLFGSLTVIGLVTGMPYLLGVLPPIIDNKYILALIVFSSVPLTIYLIVLLIIEDYAHPLVFYLSGGITAITYTFYSLYHP
ncbi:MAG: hypothetical protein FJX70_07945 [Alphaproteobacteria bacterium]|nr:hypothetical protein [Alphaproteobacteria bacterium]